MIRAFRRWANKPLDRGKALAALFLNQLATPGLGSLMAGRRVSGSLQLLLACAGFALLLAWFIRMMVIYYSMVASDFPEAEPDLKHAWWRIGAVIFGTAWLWSLVTSLFLLREARDRARRALLEEEIKPPVITRPQSPV